MVALMEIAIAYIIINYIYKKLFDYIVNSRQKAIQRVVGPYNKRLNDIRNGKVGLKSYVKRKVKERHSAPTIKEDNTVDTAGTTSEEVSI